MRLVRPVRLLLFFVLLCAFSSAAFAQIGINISIAPPVLPVYDQPECPGDGYLWTPGYWAWGDDGYYWVPGTWVMAPEVGFLWTPPWWGWENGFYLFHDGYWGPQVGFYGGINYGFGYFGTGFYGGRWQGDHFFYNREVMNVNVTNIRNVYNEHVDIRNNTHVAFNGGRDGIQVRPTAQEEAAGRERHVGPVAAQTQHVQEARGNPQFRASANHGQPPVAATRRAGDFREGAVTPRGESAAARGGASNNYAHVRDLPPSEHMPAPNTGDKKADARYAKQQQKLESQQEKERQNLQKQQDKEHAQLAKQNANEERKQQVEQKHQQQTQALSQRHTEQRQQMQSHASAPSHSSGGGARPK